MQKLLYGILKCVMQKLELMTYSRIFLILHTHFSFKDFLIRIISSMSWVTVFDKITVFAEGDSYGMCGVRDKIRQKCEYDF